MSQQMTKSQTGGSSALMDVLGANGVLKRLVEKSGGDEAFAKRFKNELLTVVTTNKYLQNCSAQSILAAAGQAATLKLSISPSLGYAYIVPYKNEATFQVGYKGLIQLAQRTGLYRKIRGVEVYAGELKDYNRLTGDFSFGKRTGDEVVGYLSYFELINGFQNMLFISKEDMEKHALMYSQSYKNDRQKGWSSSVWSTQFDKMGVKTVLKHLLSKYGPLSIDMQQAIQADQSVVNTDGTYTYIDNEHSKTVDTVTGEIMQTPPEITEGENPPTVETPPINTEVSMAATMEESKNDSGMPEIDFD